jgi:hypothetical protein
MSTPSVYQQNDILVFSGWIKRSANFHRSTQVTKNYVLIRQIQRYKGLLLQYYWININFSSPLARRKRVLYSTVEVVNKKNGAGSFQ